MDARHGPIIPGSEAAPDPAGLRARGAANAAIVALGEISGKLASLALVAVLARKGGAAAVGLWVYALSLCQITTMAVDFGLDRWMLRRIAADHSEYRARFASVMGLKSLLVVPAAGLTYGALLLLGSGPHARGVVMILFAGFVFDAVVRAMDHVFGAMDRGALSAPGTVAQRVIAAGLGIAALEERRGVTGVAVAYTIASGVAVGITVWQLHHHIGSPGWRLRWRGARSVAAASAPFAIQDVVTVLLFRVDAVILSAMAGIAVVGRYGAAYRLLESTMFISSSIVTGFVAMFTYLGRDSAPSVQSVFAGAVKLALALLVPVALVFGIFSGDVMRLFYGARLSGAGSTLALLSPVVALLGVVTMTSSMIVSREHPRNMIKLTLAMVALNVGLNVALIPSLKADGAAIAMLATEVVFLAAALTITRRLIGAIPWARNLGAVAAGGAAMAALLTLLPGRWLVVSAAGLALYAAVFAIVEHRLAPDGLRALLRRRSRSGAVAQDPGGDAADDGPRLGG